MATVSARPKRPQQPDLKPERSTTLRVRTVPESRPPAVVMAGRALAPPAQRPLALDLAELQPEPDRQRLVPDVRSWSPRSSPRLPDAYAWSLSLAQAIIETLQHRRPATQLVRWVDDEVLAAINLQSGSPEMAPGPGQPTLIRSVRVQFTRNEVIEVAVHLTRDGRSRAMAMRLEARDRRWWCTALELGPRPALAFSDPVPEAKRRSASKPDAKRRSASKSAEPKRR